MPNLHDPVRGPDETLEQYDERKRKSRFLVKVSTALPRQARIGRRADRKPAKPPKPITSDEPKFKANYVFDAINKEKT